MSQNWAELLDLVYTHDQEWEYFAEGDIGIDDSHPFVERTSLNSHQAKSALSFLKRHEIIKDTGSHYELTQKGFDVARERKSKTRQREHDKGIRFLTVVLALSAVFQLLSRAGLPAGFIQFTAVALASFTLGGIIFILD